MSPFVFYPRSPLPCSPVPAKAPHVRCPEQGTLFDLYRKVDTAKLWHHDVGEDAPFRVLRLHASGADSYRSVSATLTITAATFSSLTSRSIQKVIGIACLPSLRYGQNAHLPAETDCQS